MEFQIIHKIRRAEEKTDYDSTIFKVNASTIFDFDKTEDMGIIFKTLIQGGLRKVIVDMDGLTFIDSLGIGMLINVAKLLRARKGDITLINVPETVGRIFRPINLPRFIKIFDTEDAAVKYLKVFV